MTADSRTIVLRAVVWSDTVYAGGEGDFPVSCALVPELVIAATRIVGGKRLSAIHEHARTIQVSAVVELAG